MFVYNGASLSTEHKRSLQALSAQLTELRQKGKKQKSKKIKIVPKSPLNVTSFFVDVYGNCWTQCWPNQLYSFVTGNLVSLSKSKRRKNAKTSKIVFRKMSKIWYSVLVVLGVCRRLRSSLAK